MKQILAVSRKTAGRPTTLEPPPEGWSWLAVSNLPRGDYMVRIGAELEHDAAGDEAEDLGDEAVSAAIVRRGLEAADATGVAWERLVSSQSKVIGQLVDVLGKKIELPPSSDGSLWNLLESAAPHVKGLLETASKIRDAKQGTAAAAPAAAPAK